MISGPDISRYQGADAMDGHDFVILNVEDPFFGSKVAHAYDIGIRWDIYKWCYMDTSGRTMFDVAKRNVDAVWHPGTRYPQFWLDYEDAGVAPWQFQEWFLACDTAGVACGLYVYLYLMNAQVLSFARDGWLAYYPGNNDGTYYPAMSDEARARNAKIHQYTSTGGTLDMNVILDEAWYAASGGGPQPEAEDEDMLTYVQHATEDHGIYVTNWIHKRGVTGAEWAYVLSLAAISGKPPPPVLQLSAIIWDSIPVAGAGEVGGGGKPLKVTLSGTAVPG